MTPEQTAALDIARGLAGLGIPIFVAAPDPAAATGFRLPSGWQHTRPDPAVVDTWRPGMALCAVMGCGLDLVDVDPRSGGDLSQLDGALPTSYAAALTPSGGVHSFVRSIGVRSRDGVLPGVDVKSGDLEGKGRGFAFIAPTVRISKVTGMPAVYRWAPAPDLGRLAPALAGQTVDLSGERLRALIDAARGPKPPADPLAVFMTPDKAGPWGDIAGTLAAGRNAGVAKLAHALRGRGGLSLEDALAIMYGRVWPLIDQEQGGHAFEAAEFEAAITAAWRQYPDGAEQRAAAAAVAPDPAVLFAAAAPADAESPAMARYFGPGGIQAATLATDVMMVGPLRLGRDDICWAYSEGVWHPEKHAVRDRLTRLLGERFRTGHVGTVEAMVRAYAGRIDCDPVSDLVNFRNGLLDWRTGQLVPHDPDVLSTVQLSVDYDPEATCPAFDRFLEQVLPPDMVAVVWELLGYLMYSGNPLHKAVMLTGTGRNGKGTFLRVVQTLLGRQNTTSASLHDLLTTRFTTASLFGKLANIAGDIDATYLENTAVFKGITGGDTISAEHKGRDRFDFAPWAVPVFSANKIPASADTTIGYLSRWLVVPFPNDFTGREDRKLDGKLGTEAELRGIAAKALRALPALLERGDFELTESGRAAREEFMRRVDQVRTWLADCCDIDDAHPWVPRTTLYQAYTRWAGRDGHKAVRASEFYDRLEAAGGVPAKVHGVRGFYKVRVLDDGWIGGGSNPLGAAGAPVSNSAQPAAQPNLGADADREDLGVGADTAVPPAPNEISSDTSDNAATDQGLGAEGAGIHNPPTRARVRVGKQQTPVCVRVGGLEAPAPSAPTPAAKSRAEATAARRVAAIADAAGQSFERLPVTVTAAGAVAPCTPAEAAALLRGTAEVTVDVETSGYPVGHRWFELRTVQLGHRAFAVVLDPADPDQAEVIRTTLAGAEILHAHSATADLVPLAEAGLVDAESAWARMYDTVIPAKLADPSSTGSDPGLKQLARHVLGDEARSPAADAARAELFKAGKWLTQIRSDTPRERSGWDQVDHTCETMLRYDAADVLDDAELAHRLPEVPAELLERERTAQRMTARVAHRGLRIDAEHVLELRARQQAAQADATERLTAYGIDNPGSDAQVAAAIERHGLILPRTPTGKPSVAKGAIERHARAEGALGDLVRARLDYQVAENRLGLFLEPYHQLVAHGDGRARPTIYTLAADTGRMSAVRPNLQQVPREGGFRACLTADPGHLLVSADFAGVELRVAAALSGDRNLRAILADPERDVHAEVARIAFGPTAGKPERYMAKRGVFGRIYGGGVAAIAAGVGVDDATARAIIEALDTMLPELSEWSRMVRQAVQSGHTQFPTYAGRVVHLQQAFPHKAPNYCIQGTARELLIDALMRWQHTRWGTCTLLPVHDELLVHVPEDDAAEATAALVDAMTTELHGVQIVAEASEPSFKWRDAA